MYVDPNAPGIFWVKRHWLHVRTNLAPLLRPVGADFFPPTDKIAFERSRPLHVGGHESESCVGISHVEGHTNPVGPRFAGIMGM